MILRITNCSPEDVTSIVGGLNSFDKFAFTLRLLAPPLCSTAPACYLSACTVGPPTARAASFCGTSSAFRDLASHRGDVTESIVECLLVERFLEGVLAELVMTLQDIEELDCVCLLYTSPSPRDA